MVDFGVALTLLADAVYRHFAHSPHATRQRQIPGTIREYLINGVGELRFSRAH